MGLAISVRRRRPASESRIASPRRFPGRSRPPPTPARPLQWRVASASTLIAILDELDKVHPDTGELIPSQPEGYLAVNHLWDAAGRRVTLHAARNEFVAFQVLLRSPIPVPAGSIRPELVFDGPAGKAIQVAFGRYHPVRSPSGPFTDPIVPLGFPAATPLRKTRACTPRFTSRTTSPPGSIPGR